MCKSIKSFKRWGFVKGVESFEDKIPKDTAIREFFEEASIKVEKKYLNTIFYQSNSYKNIGIYLVDAQKIENISKYFKNNKLKSIYLDKENSDIEFKDIEKLPKIKQKQKKIKKDIVKFLKDKNFL